MKTSIQLIAQKILDIKTLNTDQVTEIVNVLSMAMETEKQQIIEAYDEGTWQETNKYQGSLSYYNSVFIDSNEVDA